MDPQYIIELIIDHMKRSLHIKRKAIVSVMINCLDNHTSSRYTSCSHPSHITPIDPDYSIDYLFEKAKAEYQQISTNIS